MQNGVGGVKEIVTEAQQIPVKKSISNTKVTFLMLFPHLGGCVVMLSKSRLPAVSFRRWETLYLKCLSSYFNIWCDFLNVKQKSGGGGKFFSRGARDCFGFSSSRCQIPFSLGKVERPRNHKKAAFHP